VDAAMALRVQALRKDFLAQRVGAMVANSQLVAIAHTGNITDSRRLDVQRAVREAGGDVTFCKNSLKARGLKRAGAGNLTPLLQGPTALATGPAEVPLAAALHRLTKSMPDFFVVGALLNQDRPLQVRLRRVKGAPHAQRPSEHVPFWCSRRSWTSTNSRLCRPRTCCTCSLSRRCCQARACRYPMSARTL
jgi:hypothetical protein